MRLKHIVGLLSAAAMSVVLAGAASAQDKTVKIGAIFPLSGNAASAGVHAKAAIETAVEIINTGNPGLGNLPVTKNAGLKGLGGAKVEVVFADNQGTPAAGQNQALRLITEEKVVALTGAYQSGITVTASAIAEKYGIPFVNGESVAANLTERGFKWFFRTTPVAGDFARIYLDFLKEMKAGGQKVDNIALVHENTEYGTSVANVITALFKENGLPIAQDIAYSANTTDVQSQVLQLKDKKPDVVIMISYTSDAILYAKTFQALDYKPPMMIADNAGFSDPSTLKTVGKSIQGIFNRSSFAIGAAGTPTYLINEMYKKKSGGDDMDDTAARQMQGFFVLVDAIDRAGSTEPAKIQAALKATDLKPDQLIMGYKGVKFDEKGQNILAAGLVIQLEGDNYVPVWPKQLAKTAPVFPYKGW
jgi:branched-chain amino acid transport system substrate-binding protein